mmetsp:Transcript_965/g.1488  ORF Transcript_965/g.1488 Transcript_965/m.1488 type:complete len:91 (+) Transcript_965:1432-1704(+)
MMGTLLSSAVAQFVRLSNCPRFQPGEEGNPLIAVGENSSTLDEEACNRFFLHLAQRVMQGQAETTAKDEIHRKGRYREQIRCMIYFGAYY